VPSTTAGVSTSVRTWCWVRAARVTMATCCWRTATTVWTWTSVPPSPPAATTAPTRRDHTPAPAHLDTSSSRTAGDARQKVRDLLLCCWFVCCFQCLFIRSAYLGQGRDRIHIMIYASRLPYQTVANTISRCIGELLQPYCL